MPMSRESAEPGAVSAPPREERGGPWALPQIEEALRGLEFGQVTVIVQDGVVVQVERTERKRFQRGGRRQ
jgi:hypothetical protein